MNKIKYLIIISVFFISYSAIAQTPNSWTRIADCGDTVRGGAVAFSIDSFGYVCLGSLPNTMSGGYIYPTVLWQFNPYSNVWSQKANFPGYGREDAICFVIGSKAYIGLGDEDGVEYKDFWEYDPTADTWTQKADFGGGGRTSAIGFSIGNKGYAGLGISATLRSTKDFWQYDPATDAWTQKNDFMGLPRLGASAFSIGGSGYVALGFDGAYPLHGLSLDDLWQYDTPSDSWTQKANYPGKADAGAFTFTIGDIAYLGTGFDSTYKTYSDFWKYDPQTDAWVRKDSFGGGTKQAAVAFSIENKGYAGTGDATNVAYGSNDFWVYTPDSLPTGIRGIDESSISIYPDPVSDRLIINNITPHTAIIITDMLGQVMIRDIAETSKISINVSSLPPGVYCVNNRKFVKE